MTKSERMKPIIKIAEERENVAIKRLQDALNKQRERQARLDELLAYKEEYQGKFSSTGGHARSAFQFNDYIAFLARLDVILAEQRRLLAASEEEVERERHAWMKLREKTQSLEKAGERFLTEERAIQDKKEQKDADERAQRFKRLDQEFEV